jgi:hypothetical protein
MKVQCLEWKEYKSNAFLDLFEEVERSIGASNAHVEWGLQV